MTLSDAVTSTRIVLSPLFFLAFFLPRWSAIPDALSIALLWILFSVIEASDLADGAIARRLSQTSDTGKLLDPFADSLSRLTYFLCFTMTGIMPVWIFLIVLYRDLAVGFIRLLVLKEGLALSARLSGKIKAWVYAAAGIGGLARQTSEINSTTAPLGRVIDGGATLFYYCAGLVAIWSLLDYLGTVRRRREGRA